MKAKEIREKNESELKELCAELRRKLWQARFDNFASQLDDTDSIRRLRRDIARATTILAELTNPKKKGQAA